MNEPQKRIISITTALAMVLALIIVAGIPLGYFLVKYYNLDEVLKARAEARAILATQIISKNPDLWQFESIRLEHFLLQATDSGEPEEQRIIDLKGQIVAQTSRRLASPVHTVSYPLYESGRLVAYLEISRSLRPLLDYSLFIGVLSLLLGAAGYVTLKSYPLRALSQTLTLLNKERQRFQVIFQSSLMAVAVLDRDCTILDANPTFLNLTLMSKEELRDYNFADLELSEGREGMGPLFQELLEGKLESFHLEMCYQRRDGVLRWGDLSVFALRGATKENLSFFAMFNDITRRKQVEEDLRQSESKYRALVETSFDWIWEVDAQSRYTFATPKVVDILGYSPEEMLGRTPFEFMPEDEASRIKAAFEAIAAERRPFESIENVNLHRNGQRVVLETSGVPKFGPNGELTGYRGTDRDVTKRKLAEEALAAEAIRRRILVEQSRDGIVVLDQNGKVYEANQRYAELLGYSPEEIRELHVWDWDAQWTREELLEKIRLVDADGDHFETRHRRRDGTILDVEISTNGAVLAGQKLVFCVCRDISQRKQAEKEIIRQREEMRGLAIRLAEVEEMERQQLARELHDQVCQNLAAINIILETLMIRAQREPLDKLLSRLAEVGAVAEQTSEITREIMEGLRPTVLDHYGLMGGLRHLGNQFSQRTGINLKVQEDGAQPRLAPKVELALFRIAQEALNNAAKHARPSQVVVTKEESQDSVRLVIEDNGTGFDPNLVTQPKNGRGWGLMTMTERATAVGGHCHIESQPGQGTRVVVEVPR